MRTRILGTGSSVPERIVTNDDLSKVVDTSDEWITTRTGIRERRVATTETAASLAYQAAKRALENAACDAVDLDAIIVATSSPDYTFPNTASLVQNMLHAVNAFCFDISVACTGFIYALSIADAYIRLGMCKKVLIIGADLMSATVDWKDRSVCVLFGDGAGAVVVGAEEKEDCGILQTCLHTDGSKGMALTYNDIHNRITPMMLEEQMQKDYVQMDGQEVFKFTVKKVPDSILEVSKLAGVELAEIKYCVLHQANLRIIQAVAKKLHLDMEHFPVNLMKYGNTSAASIPILLDEMNQSDQLQSGDNIILSGFGAGLSWGSMYLKW